MLSGNIAHNGLNRFPTLTLKQSGGMFKCNLVSNLQLCKTLTCKNKYICKVNICLNTNSQLNNSNRAIVILGEIYKIQLCDLITTTIKCLYFLFVYFDPFRPP